jgi:hypothetical protein
MPWISDLAMAPKITNRSIGPPRTFHGKEGQNSLVKRDLLFQKTWQSE